MCPAPAIILRSENFRFGAHAAAFDCRPPHQLIVRQNNNNVHRRHIDAFGEMLCVRWSRSQLICVLHFYTHFKQYYSHAIIKLYCFIIVIMSKMIDEYKMRCRTILSKIHSHAETQPKEKVEKMHSWRCSDSQRFFFFSFVFNFIFQ